MKEENEVGGKGRRVGAGAAGVGGGTAVMAPGEVLSQTLCSLQGCGLTAPGQRLLLPADF